MDLFDFAIQNGVSGLLIVILYFFTKHHLKILKDHVKAIDKLKEEFKKELEKVQNDKDELEKELREKVEELLKDQLSTQQPQTEALIESNRLLREIRVYFRSTNDSTQG